MTFHRPHVEQCVWCRRWVASYVHRRVHGRSEIRCTDGLCQAVWDRNHPHLARRAS